MTTMLAECRLAGHAFVPPENNHIDLESHEQCLPNITEESAWSANARADIRMASIITYTTSIIQYVVANSDLWSSALDHQQSSVANARSTHLWSACFQSLLGRAFNH